MKKHNIFLGMALFFYLFFNILVANDALSESVYTISGIVKDDAGAVIKGLNVMLERTYSNGLFTSLSETVTDDNGYYALSGDGLPAGEGSWYTLYVSGRRKPCGPSNPQDYTYTSLDGQYDNQDFTVFPGNPLKLLWVTDEGFQTDGIDPDAPTAGVNALFKVRGRAEIDSWQIAKIFLYIEKNGQPISGSPFEMALDGILSYGPDFEAIYKYDKVLLEAGSYTYHFQGIDVIGDPAVGEPIEPKDFVVNVDLRNLVKTEADYILQCQFMDSANSAYGCINNVFGEPTWVVPRENAMAVLGLVRASAILEDSLYYDRAQLALDYFVRVQDTDGAWYNQYGYAVPGDPNNPGNLEAKAKSPTQTAEVMIAFYKSGYNPARYNAMRKGAIYLMDCQKIAFGGNGYLIGGGKDSEGNFRSWRWASDNAYGYQALKAAQAWAITKKNVSFASLCANSASRILQGINNTLYVSNSLDPDYGSWRRVVDEQNQPIDPDSHDWINYAPQMLDLPASGVDQPQIGDWIHNNLQKEDGACVWDNAVYNERKSPGYSFQAGLCWQDLGQNNYFEPALVWAQDSNLWQTTPDSRGVIGGWIDWREPSFTAQWWERFIDTSFYAIAAYSNGYNFRIMPAYLRAAKAMRSSAALADIDNDGQEEIIAGSYDSYLYVWRPDGRLMAGWPQPTIGAIDAPAAVGDIDNDGKLEIIAGAHDKSSSTGPRKIYAWDSQGNLRWSKDVTGWLYGSPALGDIDGDGKLDVVVKDSSGYLYVFDGQGNPLPGWDKKYLGALGGNSSVALADIDKDGRLDIIVTTARQIKVFDRDGGLLSGWPRGISGQGASPVVGDVNNDGWPEIVAASLYGDVYVFNYKGGLLAGWPKKVEGLVYPVSSPALADVNGDNKLEIFLSYSSSDYLKGWVTAFKINGSLLSGWPVQAGSGIHSSPIIGDVNGDGREEIIAGCDDKMVYVWRKSGILYGKETTLGKLWPCGALGDINADGNVELVIGSDSAKVYLFLYPGRFNPGKMSWPMFGNNNRRTASVF